MKEPHITQETIEQPLPGPVEQPKEDFDGLLFFGISILWIFIICIVLFLGGNDWGY